MPVLSAQKNNKKMLKHYIIFRIMKKVPVRRTGAYRHKKTLVIVVVVVVRVVPVARVGICERLSLYNYTHDYKSV